MDKLGLHSMFSLQIDVDAVVSLLDIRGNDIHIRLQGNKDMPFPQLASLTASPRLVPRATCPCHL